MSVGERKILSLKPIIPIRRSVADLLKERYDDPSSPLHRLFDDATLKELIESKGASYTLPWYGQLMSGPQLLAYLYQIDQWILTYHVQLDF